MRRSVGIDADDQASVSSRRPTLTISPGVATSGFLDICEDVRQLAVEPAQLPRGGPKSVQPPTTL